MFGGLEEQIERMDNKLQFDTFKKRKAENTSWRYHACHAETSSNTAHAAYDVFLKATTCRTWQQIYESTIWIC